MRPSTWIRRLSFAILAVAFGLSLPAISSICTAMAQEIANEKDEKGQGNDDFSSVQKFVATYCVDCHGPELQEADRRFDQLIPSDPNAVQSVSSQVLDSSEREHWREILDRLNSGDMPPSDADKQPTDQERLRTIKRLTDQLIRKSSTNDGADAQPALRRLNKSEYDRSVRSLLGLEEMLADPTASFSPDEKKDGFSTVAESLVISDFLMNRYLDAADQYLAAAIDIATRQTDSKSTNFQAPFFRENNVGDGLNRDGEYQHIRENASDTGGYLWLQDLRKGVPASGYYKIRVRATAINRIHPYKDWILDVPQVDPLVMSIVAADAKQSKNPKTNHATDRVLAEFVISDEEPKWYETEAWIDRGYLLKFGYPNGPRRIKYQRHSLMYHHRESFPRFLTEHVPVFSDMHPDYDKEEAPPMVEKFLAEQEELRKAGKPYAVFGVDHLLHTNEAWRTFYSEYKGPRIRVFEIELAGPSKNEPLPAVAALTNKKLTDEQAKIAIKGFATRAARGKLSDEKLQPIIELYTSARQNISVGEATKLAYKAILCSPFFIYHRTRSGKLDDFELASRLSFFLTGGPPDDELLRVAKDGSISDSKTLRKQAQRLLKQPESKTFINSFANAWLRLSKLGTMLPNFDEHPGYYNERLESAMREETMSFLAEAFENDRPVNWLIDADTTFLNAPLARLYGIPNVDGLEMRQVKLSGRKMGPNVTNASGGSGRLRGGLLGQASILTASANGIDTSPVTRGVWVLECLLGTPPSPPPPDIEPLEPDTRGAVTIREQLKKHRDVVSCQHCHRRIDPLGFALETFDEIGRTREFYGEGKGKTLIETGGELPTGETFNDIAQLRKLLLKQTSLIERNLATKLLIQATGRIDDANDAADVLAILRNVANDKGGLKTATKPSLGIREILLRVIASEAFGH